MKTEIAKLTLRSFQALQVTKVSSVNVIVNVLLIRMGVQMTVVMKFRLTKKLVQQKLPKKFGLNPFSDRNEVQNKTSMNQKQMQLAKCQERMRCVFVKKNETEMMMIDAINQCAHHVQQIFSKTTNDTVRTDTHTHPHQAKKIKELKKL